MCLDFFSCRDPFAGVPLNESRLTGPLPSGGCDDVEDLGEAVDAFEAALLCTKSNPPALVTVARSARDGYCPPSLVDELERRVIDAVGRVYGDLGVAASAAALDGKTGARRGRSFASAFRPGAEARRAASFEGERDGEATFFVQRSTRPRSLGRPWPSRGSMPGRRAVNTR